MDLSDEMVKSQEGHLQWVGSGFLALMLQALGFDIWFSDLVSGLRYLCDLVENRRVGLLRL